MTIVKPSAAAALALLLALGVEGCGRRTAAPVPSHGAQLYARLCQSCHGASGEGVRGMQPPLAGTPLPLGPVEPLLGWVMYGRRPAALPRGVYAGVMPQFAFLTDVDVAAILTHVRSSFGNQAAVVTPAMVAAARAAQRGG